MVGGAQGHREAGIEMAQITVCDICAAKPAQGIQVRVGFTFDGVETVSDYERVDLCIEHAIYFAQEAFRCLPEDKRAAAFSQMKVAMRPR